MFRFLCGLSLALVTVPLPSFSIPSTSYPAPKKAVTKIGSELWIEQKLRQYPELLWLADVPANLSSQRSSFEENSQHPSEVLFERESPGFDDTIRSLIYLHLLLNGSRLSYVTLTRLIKPTEALPSFKLFQSLHKQLVKYLNSPKAFDNSVKILETSLVLKNIGYSRKARQLFQPYFTENDPALFYDKAMLVLKAFPELSPSYSRLSQEQKDAFLSLRKLDNYGDLLSLTKSPSKKLLQLSRTKYPVVLLDACLYNLDAFGAGIPREEFYQNLQVFSAYLQQNSTLEEAFSRYLSFRANKLGFEGQTKADMTLVRLASLMNISSPNEAAALLWSFQNLSSEELGHIISAFYSSSGEYLERDIRGLPALTTGLAAITPSTIVGVEPRLRQVFSATLSLLAKGLKTEKEMLQKQLLPKGTVLDFVETASTFGGLNVFSDTIFVRIHLNGSVSIYA
ncbi:hypothetical protein [Chlamydiifrater phoenicopteri]|uniref:hypothetical protein n=1 Tax=Chlamydiifrater phoenicopteri TaxID=2681469 RepID=UPI001BCCE0ED|nr:hypothetical protein [Chlamydiifrater phoenicopteri]